MRSRMKKRMILKLRTLVREGIMVTFTIIQKKSPKSTIFCLKSFMPITLKNLAFSILRAQDKVNTRQESKPEPNSIWIAQIMTKPVL